MSTNLDRDLSLAHKHFKVLDIDLNHKVWIENTLVNTNISYIKWCTSIVYTTFHHYTHQSQSNVSKDQQSK